MSVSFHRLARSGPNNRKKESHWFISNSVRMPSTLDANKITSSEIHTELRKRKKLSKWKWRERKREKCSFSDNGFDLFLGWIRKRNDNSSEIIGWMEAGREGRNRNKTKDKETFWRIDSIFLSIFPFALDFPFPFGKAISALHDNDKDDAWNWVEDERKSWEGLFVKWVYKCDNSSPLNALQICDTSVIAADFKPQDFWSMLYKYSLH